MKPRYLQAALLAFATLLSSQATLAADPQRARDLGIPFEGTPGKLNAITDVAGVEVGQITLNSGEGKLVQGKGPVRTGVTMVLPRGKATVKAVNGGFFNLNGNGEMTGQSYLQDFGLVYGPIGISNTNAIGPVYAAITEWSATTFGNAIWPVVAETWDGRLNDIEGLHVKPEHALGAIKAAKGGPVREGNVGGGNGMVCFGFKGGIGTSSRVVEVEGKPYTVGVLVQCNTGQRDTLRIAGTPVGQELAQKWLGCFQPGVAATDKTPHCQKSGDGGAASKDLGSIIIVVATDAPLLATQLNRIAKRASMGLARMGSFAGNGSGDLIVSFSTGEAINDVEQEQPVTVIQFPNDKIDPLFNATVQATEEAITNALVAARDMIGVNGYTAYALPHDELTAILKKYNRLQP
ncbi:S58 family peptidase [Pseudomonas gingeri NCPPB 3146 = LMG 5327]|uniref:P1 family peptidase n=2 Tax=Pseudomonas gingeri TaxID=117681 RepID=A0A7Y7XV86_9PSED|nr:P1 family peptidase [Pseudomonas gingeri]NWC12724.1 P1 family peptidase [Pseudomonas gingeri]NWE49487.1 P1 family peptidase [Pseudomonas gingeri]NWE72991.1 P1 family peptidase [Pseudomonas gingeri]PNQ93003.1 S58 family peptidase [Pseudomonas gingeri NCPPB 3146 = LMG 5327]